MTDSNTAPPAREAAPADGEVVERFYRALWSYRSDLAESLTTRREGGLTRRNELLAAQRILDRLVFLYFLVERGVVVPVTGTGKMVPRDTNQMFDDLVGESDDFEAVLHAICFDRLQSKQRDRVRVSESVRLHVPYLERDLFGPETFESVGGDAVDEVEGLIVEGFDWAALIDEFNAYDWRLGRQKRAPETDGEAAGTLTPTVLGYVYEKFVIAVSKVGDEGRLEDLEAADRTELVSAGNSRVGAYYTGQAIADFTARRALWGALQEKIDADCEANLSPNGMTQEHLYRPGTSRQSAVETDEKDGFDVLVETHADRPNVLEYVDSKLRELTVCDPAIGSGSFALAVANTLVEWQSACRPDADEYELRRQIVSRNVFGVDVLDGATEICKLRLWLWLLDATPVETAGSVHERDEVAALPDIDWTIRSGNSLIGFSALPDGRGTGAPDGSATLNDHIEEYAADVQSYRRANVENGTRHELAARHDELDSRLDELYAQTRNGVDDEPLTIVDHVGDADAAVRSLQASPGPRTGLRINVPTGIPESVEAYLDTLGFASYTYTARIDRPSLESGAVAGLFAHLDAAFDSPEEWTVVVERPYAAEDFETDTLDACHWPLEFPDVFCEDGGFDVVISNPPYGAAISPEAEPLLKSEATYECQGANDSCEWFYERALDLVHDAGVVSYVVTKSVAFYSSWADIRQTILKETALTHVFDVGLGFDGVNLETIAMVHSLGNDGDESVPAVHRSRDRRSTTTNEPVHLGWVPQRFMQDTGTIIFRPITDDQRAVLERLLSNDRRLGDVMSTSDTTRQLYVPDSEKEKLDPGDDHFINKNPWVQEFYIENVWHTDLDDYRDSVEEYAVPRVMLKVLRGTRLRAWLDPEGELVGTEKLVNVPLLDHTPAEIAFVYAALNHPCASFYLQKAIFSETTESARVMDGQYSRPIPIPDASAAMTETVAHLAWTVTMAKQVQFDSGRDLADRVECLQTALEAVVGGLYLDLEADRLREWSEELASEGPGLQAVQTLFSEFYTERFATRDGDPEQYWEDIESVVDATVLVAEGLETELITGSADMSVVEDVL